LRGIDFVASILEPPTPSKQAAKNRITLWKWNRIKDKFSTAAKQQKLQSVQRVKRRSIVDKNRGLFFSGTLNLKTNLGNHLHITDSHLSDLNRSPSMAISPLKVSLSGMELTLASTIGAPRTSQIADMVLKGEKLLLDNFAKQELKMDLIHTREDEFASSFIMFKEQVVAVAEYAMMKKYLWVESITVDETYRKRGIGRFLLEKYHLV
jgi:predicted GNAT family acetyltransferase